MKGSSGYAVVGRITAAVVCLALGLESWSGPVGYEDKSHYAIIPFSVLVAGSLFFRKLGTLRIHLFWALVVAVVAQQGYRAYAYERWRGDWQEEQLRQMGRERQIQKNEETRPDGVR